ncbi:hypothetical protein NDU88_007780 [Pleurodeles waltl]|uniref:Uncharacterized protein n=1 Tax=Pleurodeles waltl TaxID=8319 RepID=A0AAV7QSV2_PLEWA|nr:hypothetical protein NDU88_007780 [Pleurodeles waltl]
MNNLAVLHQDSSTIQRGWIRFVDLTCSVSRELEAVDTFSVSHELEAVDERCEERKELFILPSEQPGDSRAIAVAKPSRVSRLRVARLLPRVLTHWVREENADCCGYVTTLRV